MPLALRVCLFTLSAGLSAYGVGRLASLRPWLPAWAGALLGACASACLWWAMAWLERQEPHSTTYLALPAAGIAGAALAGLALLAVQRRPSASRSAPRYPRGTLKNINKYDGFAIRLLESARGGRRRGPLAAARASLSFTAESRTKRPKVLKDAIERAGY